MAVKGFYRSFAKPLADRFFALALLFISSPVFIITILVLAFANRGKVFFTQQRPGIAGRPFSVIKFRTMSDKRDHSGNLLPDAQRLTVFGQLIRKASIDELPQLLNVIIGNMSLVGPRPWLMEYVPLYTPEQARRQKVKPGITGWAQVNGRNALDWESRFKFDLYYVDHISFLFDLRILLTTVWKVLRAEGISGNGTVTMEKFKGSIVKKL